MRLLQALLAVLPYRHTYLLLPTSGDDKENASAICLLTSAARYGCLPIHPPTCVLAGGIAVGAGCRAPGEVTL